MKAAGVPGQGRHQPINWFMTELILLPHGHLRDHGLRADRGVPGRAFPARIRYTSMSLPYHIGNGWFGGMLPLLATAMVASSGNIYNGLWYPMIVAAITAVIGLVFVRESRDRRIDTL